MLVTIDRYRAITGDETTDDITASALIEEATILLEEALDRPLASAVRTERMHPRRDGTFAPHAVPVTVADDYTIDGYSLKTTTFPSFTPFPDTTAEGTDVTYTGGWVERTANVGATNALPLHIERDLAWAAWLLRDPTTVQQAATLPAGASSVSLGDAAVTFREGAPTVTLGEAGIRWSRRTLGYRYSRLGGYR